MAVESSHLQPDSEVVKELFADVCELPLAERGRFLEERCGDAPEVRAEVENLLLAHDAAGRFMANPPAAVERVVGVHPLETSDELPRYVNRFKLVRLLGEGGFGAVYEAESPTLRPMMAAPRGLFSE